MSKKQTFWRRTAVSLAALRRLARPEAAIRDLIETRMLDGHGLMYSFLNAKTLRPWTDEELKAHNLMPVCHANVNSPAEYYAYENSLMGTGEYASSQVARYLATGAPGALAAAGCQVHAIMQVFYQGELFEKGFLPKPFGGVRRCAYSHELSHDQQIKALVALRDYRQFAPPALSRRMDEYIVALADYHYARKFMHPRRESFVVNAENRPHYIAILLPVLVIAHKITGDARYLQALAKFDPMVDDCAAGRFPPGFNQAALVIEGMHLALREGHRDGRYVKAIGKLWQANLPWIDRGGLGFLNEERTRKTSEVLRLAGLAPVVHEYFPGWHPCRAGLFLLGKNTDPRKMLYVNWEAQPRDFHGPLAASLCELALSSWLLGYWRMFNLLLKEKGRP